MILKRFFIIMSALSLSCSIGHAQTQMSINMEAAKAYKKADKRLNEVYQAILSEYKTDIAFIKNLKAAQRIWIQFRDAELKMKYPMKRENYGSIHPLCISNYLEKLTNERIQTLEVWLEGIEEGDMCGGSVKVKSEDETYLIQGKRFYGIAVGDLLSDKKHLLTKDILKTGEGDFDIFIIKNDSGTPIAQIFPDPVNEARIGDIAIITPLTITQEGIHIGMTFGDLEAILGAVEVHGSEIEGTTSILKDNIRYTLDVNFWTYKVDKSKISKNTKIKEIAITR